MNILKCMNSKARSLKDSTVKHSPELLLVGGITLGIAGAIVACKSTIKAKGIVDDAKKDLETIAEARKISEDKKANEDDSDKEELYSEEDAAKETMNTYIKAGIHITKSYIPALILGGLSIGCILKSNNILKGRYVTLSTAFAALDTGFKEYRGRVVNKFGEMVDTELKHNLKAVTVSESVVDEEGKKKTVKKVKYETQNGVEVTEYSRFFEEYTIDTCTGEWVMNPNWKSNNHFNYQFLKNMERYANDVLTVKGYLFLNDVYEMLGLTKSKVGQKIGWKYNPDEYNKISFGLCDPRVDDTTSRYIDGYEDCILLNFNVDGDISDIFCLKN